MLPLEDGVPGHDGGPAARGRRGGGAPCPRPRDAQPLGLEADLVPHPQPALGRGGARPRHRQRHPRSVGNRASYVVNYQILRVLPDLKS